MSRLRDDLIATYASILHEEKEVAFLIEDTESLAVISENVGDDEANWNVDVYTPDSMNHYIPRDGGFAGGDAKEAITVAVNIYEAWLSKPAGGE